MLKNKMKTSAQGEVKAGLEHVTRRQGGESPVLRDPWEVGCEPPRGQHTGRLVTLTAHVYLVSERRDWRVSYTRLSFVSDAGGGVHA